MVLPLEGQYFLVAYGVVAFLVVQVHQRSDLWERVGNVLQQSLRLLLAARLVVVELNDDHPLSRLRVAYDDVAQQSRLGAQVEECQAVADGIVANLVPDLVVQVVHQPAFLDGQDLVEGSGDVEADGRDVF